LEAATIFCHRLDCHTWSVAGMAGDQGRWGHAGGSIILEDGLQAMFRRGKVQKRASEPVTSVMSVMSVTSVMSVLALSEFIQATNLKGKMGIGNQRRLDRTAADGWDGGRAG
jgi:hypothetical protein